MTHHYWPLKICLIFYVFLSGLRHFLLIIVFTFLIVSFYAYIFSIWSHLDTLSKSVSFLVSWTYWIVLTLPLKGLPLLQLDRGLFLSLLSATQLLTGILEYAYMSDTIHSYDTEPKREACFFSTSFFQCRHLNYKQRFSISSFCRSNILLQNIYPVLDELNETKIFFRTWRGGLAYWKTKDTLLNYFDIIALFSCLIKYVTPK